MLRLEVAIKLRRSFGVAVRPCSWVAERPDRAAVVRGAGLAALIDATTEDSCDVAGRVPPGRATDVLLNAARWRRRRGRQPIDEIKHTGGPGRVGVRLHFHQYARCRSGVPGQWGGVTATIPATLRSAHRL